MTKTAVGSEEPDENKPELKEGEAVIKGGHISAGSIMPASITLSEINSNAINATTISVGTIDASKITAHTLLFGAWIRDTKTLQEQFYGKSFEDFTQEELEDWIRINVLAAEDELHEALGEVSWKPWAKSAYFNREAFLGEIVDVLHFVGNLLAGAGITDAELNKAYLEKMERNRERQRSGYTGLDKCAVCKRATDDIEAHGGFCMETPDGGTLCGDCAVQKGVLP